MDAQGYFTSLLNEGITTHNTDPFSSPTDEHECPNVENTNNEAGCPNVEKTPSGRPN
ncbi:hypothetical protein ACP70R_044768 [Stipagrostis hirtigluma subsp. patula]